MMARMPEFYLCGRPLQSIFELLGTNENDLTYRMDTAVQALDDVINAVQRGRQSRGDELVPTRDLGPW